MAQLGTKQTLDEGTGKDRPTDQSAKTGRDDKIARLKPKAAKPAALDGDDWLGAKLREAYQDVVSEPVPDDFLELLDQLDQGVTMSKDGGADKDG